MSKRINAILSVFYGLLAISPGLFAQQEVGQIGSLITAEYNMGNIGKSRGLLAAFNWATDKSTLLFVPEPVAAPDYLKDRPALPDVMTWQPSFAKVAMSDDWGFTTGATTWQRVGSHQRYGEYLSLWKRDQKGEWKLAFRAVTEHGRPVFKASHVYANPESDQYVKVRSKTRLKQREDIIASTDQLFATILKADNATAFKEFHSDQTRFYVPSFEAVVGVDDVQRFLKREKLSITSEPGSVDRSYSGELAFSTGEATISQGISVKHCHYLRIWEKQENNLWKVIVDMYVER